MTTKTVHMSQKAWQAAEAEFANRVNFAVPQGWYSAAQYASTRNPPMTLSGASRRLKQMFTAGVVERKLWTSRMFIYRPVQK